jgi:phosphate transport system protein
VTTPATPLPEIEEGIQHLFELVIEALSLATRSLLDGEIEIGQRVVTADQVIDDLTSDLDSRIWVRIDQAAGSAELKPLIAMLLMLSEMERSADLAEHIARRAVAGLGGEMTTLSRALIQRMSEVATEMWTDTGAAYREYGAIGVALDESDEEMDILHARLSDEIAVGAMANVFAVQVTMLARFYERLGDHAVNIARRIEALNYGSV